MRGRYPLESEKGTVNLWEFTHMASDKYKIWKESKVIAYEKDSQRIAGDGHGSGNEPDCIRNRIW